MTARVMVDASLVRRLTARSAELAPPSDGGRAEARAERRLGFIDARATLAAQRAAPFAETVDYLRRVYPGKGWRGTHEVAGVLFDAERVADMALGGAR